MYSRSQLLNAVWGYTHDGYEHTVTTHINRLRAKLAERHPVVTRAVSLESQLAGVGGLAAGEPDAAKRKERAWALYVQVVLAASEFLYVK